MTLYATLRFTIQCNIRRFAHNRNSFVAANAFNFGTKRDTLVNKLINNV